MQQKVSVSLEVVGLRQVPGLRQVLELALELQVLCEALVWGRWVWEPPIAPALPVSPLAPLGCGTSVHGAPLPCCCSVPALRILGGTLGRAGCSVIFRAMNV